MKAELAVLMTAYNADKTIKQTVQSLLASLIPIDLCIVDDGSRVPVADMLGPLPDSVEIVTLPENVGLANAKNAGLAHLVEKGYDFIAMMDADDISYPQRFARQLAFLKAKPNVAIVGAWARFIDEHTGEVVFNFCPPDDPEEIRQGLFFNGCLVHPTWMLRTDILRRHGLYSTAYPAAEDYELLRRVAAHADLSNVPEFLLDYRISSTGISIKKRRRQLFDRLRIQWRHVEPLQWRCWGGMIQTLALFCVPTPVVTALKARRRGGGDSRDVVLEGGQPAQVDRPS